MGDYRNTRASFDHPSTTPPIRAPLSTMAFGGALLRFGQTGLRLLEFACAAIVLGIYSYFLSVLADKNIHIPAWEKAVEGMSGAACLYLIFCVLLTLFLGGIRFFAVSIVNIFLFLVTAVVQFLLARHHQKEKRYGPSPSNNYTSGTGRRPFWKRNRKASRGTRDAEMATTAASPGHHGTTVRPSHETGMTGSTMNNAGHAPYASEPKYGQPGYGMAPGHHNATTGTNY